MITRRIRFLVSGLPLAAVFLAAVSPAAHVAAQEEPLGQPAGWAVTDSESLIAIAPGSELHIEPDQATRLITVLPDARLPLVEVRDNWVKVRYGDHVGWVDLEAPREPARAPAPRLVVIEPEPLDIGEGWLKDVLGPYKLFSKGSEPTLIDLLGRVAGEHARIYAERYGLALNAELTGSVMLFAGRQSFLDFQRSRGHDAAENRIDAYFHSPDTVLMYRGRGSRHKLAATLIHELTHLINWQTLRARGETSIPPWLDEGMAEDLSMSRIDRKDRLVMEPLGPTNLRFGRHLGVRVYELGQKMALGGTAPSLRQLLAMDEETFLAGDVQLHYLMSALWIRYLLSDVDSELAGGFRAFLASVAVGGRPDSEELRSRLGRGWQQLAGDYRGWLSIRQARLGL